MLKWLATQYERRRGALQARLEGRLRDKLTSTPARQQSAELRRLGNECLAAGNLADAEQFYRQGVAADPKDPACHSNLGYVLYEQGHRSDAEESLERAVKLDQSDYDAYYLLGNIARDRQETLRAIVCYRTALRLRPEFDFCRRDLCVALAQSGRFDEAQSTMDEGPAFDESTATYHFFKGNLHSAKDEFPRARACFEKAAELSPNDTSILCNLCTAQLRAHDVFSALKTGQRMIELEPNYAQAHSLLGVTHQYLGSYSTSVAYYRRALELDPNDLATHRNLLFTLTYVADVPPEAYLAEAQSLAAKIRSRAKPFTSWHPMRAPNANRPLKVGFVSGDLRFHPVGLFLHDVLSHIDTKKMACIAYSNCAVEDAYSFALRKGFDEWNAVSQLSDAELAAKIHADQIDVLIDLAGFSGESRINVFAWCAAPVQVTWLGYWASTGMSEIDYLIADKASVAPAEEAHYAEKLWLLPETRLCFSVPPSVVEHLSAGPTPALANGYITFGSFQTLSKVTDATLELWSKVLAGLPTARLRLQSHVLGSTEYVRYFKERLESAHIDPQRVVLHAGAGWEAYMSAYREVDIVLDTIPFPGGTTTAEALWIGVPTVTLSGCTLISRQGQSMLRCAGLQDWVAHSPEGYVTIAVNKASNLEALGVLRTNLRDKVVVSPLFDARRFAGHLETALYSMYYAKLETQREQP